MVKKPDDNWTPFIPFGYDVLYCAPLIVLSLLDLMQSQPLQQKKRKNRSVITHGIIVLSYFIVL